MTNKTADGWFAAAVALTGLWAWERHLARRGTSLDDMGAWGTLLSGNVVSTVGHFATLGVLPVAAFVGAHGLMTAATSAFTNAMTPMAGEVTVDRVFDVPSLFACDPEGTGMACERDDGWDCDAIDYSE